MENTKTPIIEWLLVLLMFVLSFSASGRVQLLIFYGVPVLIILLHAVRNRGILSLRVDAIHLYVAAFCAFCYISALWAANSNYAVKKGNLLLEIFVVVTAMYLAFDNDNGVHDLLKMLQWGCYLVLIYTILTYGWSMIVLLLQDEMRISNDYINANLIGMCASYAIVINVYHMLYEKVRITDLLIILAVLIIAISQSRKSVVIVLGGIFAIFILRNFNISKLGNSMLRIVLVVICLVAAVIFLSRLEIFSGILGRMSDLFALLNGSGGDASGQIRMEYNQLGLQFFKENPFFGIGIDNARIYTLSIYGLDAYLHDNYVELAACGGITGFVLYYSIYAYIIFVMIRYHSLRDGEWDVCMTLLVVRLIIDYGMVSYETRSTYMYLLLFWLEAQKLKKKAKMPEVSGLQNQHNS